MDQTFATADATQNTIVAAILASYSGSYVEGEEPGTQLFAYALNGRYTTCIGVGVDK